MVEVPETVVELLPCPFCGGTGPRVRHNRFMSWVSCPTCGLEMPTETGVTDDQAIAAWNTRKSPETPRSGEVAVPMTDEHKLKAIFDFIEDITPEQAWEEIISKQRDDITDLASISRDELYDFMLRASHAYTPKQSPEIGAGTADREAVDTMRSAWMRIQSNKRAGTKGPISDFWDIVNAVPGVLAIVDHDDDLDGEDANRPASGDGGERPRGILIRQDTMSGQPCIAGTRIPASTIMEFHGAGYDAAGIIAEYPDLRPSDIDEALAFATASSARVAGLEEAANAVWRALCPKSFKPTRTWKNRLKAADDARAAIRALAQDTPTSGEVK